MEPGPGDDDDNVYDVVDERVGTTVEMKEMKRMVLLNQIDSVLYLIDVDINDSKDSY